MEGFPKWVWVLIAVIVVVGGWFLITRHHEPVAVGDTYKVGIILPLTGDAASYGEPAKNFMQLATDEINATGGIDGKQMELVVEDGKCDGTSAANAASKLVNIDKVQVIIGGFCSSESLSAVPVAERAKVAVISSGSSSPKLTAISDYFVRNYPSDATQGAVLANIAYTDKGWRKVAFIQEQTDYAVGIYNAFSETFTKLGGTVTNESFPTATTDFRSIITKVQGEKPDAVFLDTQTPASASRVLPQMAQLDWKLPLLLTDVTIGDPATITANAKQLEGALGAEFGTQKDNPKFTAMVSAYKTKYGADAPYLSYAQTEYDSVYLVRDAIAAVGYDGTKIAKWLHTSVKDWQGASGAVTIGANGDPVSGHSPETVTGGKMVPYVK
ncbi:MAG: ABC transporter substrate-binding protein [Patescibacteria group bacterium]